MSQNQATSSPQRAVVLLSGGLDSTTVLALAQRSGAELYALSFAYAQRHAVELEAAARQALRIGVQRHEVVDLRVLGELVRPATALIRDSEIAVPDSRAGSGKTVSPGEVRGAEPAIDPGAASARLDPSIPLTYVPARNTVFLAVALAWAESLQAQTIWLGVNAVDYSGYPDCRPAFLDAFGQVIATGTKSGVEGASVELKAPLIALHKHQIIALGEELGVDYSDTVSCYAPVSQGDAVAACGRCESCDLRRQGFARAGLSDPTRYLI